MKKIICSIFLALTMVFGVLPLGIYADGEDTTAPTISVILLSSPANFFLNGDFYVDVQFSDNSDIKSFSMVYQSTVDSSKTFTIDVAYTSGNYPTHDGIALTRVTQAIPSSQTLGSYLIKSVTVSDIYDNSRTYNLVQNSEDQVSDAQNNYIGVSKILIASEEDTTAPVVNSISIPVTTLHKSDNLSVSLNITEQGSGLKEVSMQFVNPNNQSIDLSNSYSSKKVTAEDLSFQINVGSDIDYGEYTLSRISVTDEFGNKQVYDSDNTKSIDVSNYKITLEPLNGDSEAPVINTLQLLTKNIYGTNLPAVKVSFSDNLSGVSSIMVTATNDNDTSDQFNMSLSYNPNEQAVLTGTDVIVKDSYYKARNTGTYIISRVEIIDNSNNRKSYSSETELNSIMGSNVSDRTIKYSATAPQASITGKLSDSDLISNIKNMNDDGLAIVTDDNNTIPSALFEAIKGKNQTIDVKQNNVDFIFNGMNVTTDNVKDVVTTLSLTQESGTNYGNAYDVLKLTFADVSKQLPANTIIKINNSYLDELNAKGSNLKLWFNDGRVLQDFSQQIVVKTTGDFEIKTDKLNNYIISYGDASLLTSPDAPRVTGITLSKTSIKQNESIEATLAVTKKEGAGIKSIQITYYATANDSTDPSAQRDYMSVMKDFTQPNFDADITLTLNSKPTQLSGTYHVESVSLTDTNSMKRTYVCTQANSYVLYDETNKNESAGNPPVFTVEVDPNADTIAPVMTSAHLLSTKGDKGTSVKIQFHIVEEGSGVKYVGIFFNNPNHPSNNVFLQVNKSYDTDPLKTGDYTVEMQIPTNIPSGVNTVSQISLEDAYGNKTEYSTWSTIKVSSILTDSFEVNSDGDDTAPVLNSLKIITDTVIRPDVAVIQVDYTEEGNGIESINAIFTSSKSNVGMSFNLSNYDNELIKSDVKTLKVLINKDTMLGDYTLESITLKDRSGNESCYSSFAGNFGDKVPNKVIHVVEKNENLLSTTLSYPDLLNFVKKAPNSSIISIQVDEKTAPKELFDAIANTNKTILFEERGNEYGSGVDVKDGIVWQFKGIDIVPGQSHDIDLSAYITRVHDYLNSNAKDVVKMVFPENGILPGMVTMRLKINYLSELVGDNIKNLILYYDNDSTLEQEKTTFSQTADGWLEFTLTHNSTYFISDHNMKVAPATQPEDNGPANNQPAVVTPVDKKSIDSEPAIVATKEQNETVNKLTSTADTGDHTDVPFAAGGFTLAMVLAVAVVILKKKYN